MAPTRLSPDYCIRGHFYSAKMNGRVYQFRSVLEISSQNANTDTPDLLVVMMNPGGSKPLHDSIEPQPWGIGETKTFVHAKPDKTQKQIMKLMEELNFRFARVLNVSDVREPKSEKFRQIAKGFGTDLRHSIFCDLRKNELLEALGPKETPVLAAWGLKIDKTLAEKAIRSLDGRTVIGLRPGPKPMYRHPLPRTAAAQSEWLENIVNLFTKTDAKKSG